MGKLVADMTPEEYRVRRARDEMYREKYRATVNARSKAKRQQFPKETMLHRTKMRSRVTGREFSLTADDIEIPTHCPVLGIELSVASRGHCDGSPSLDRIDNSKGYVPGNVIVISNRANKLKGDATLDELIAIVNFYRWLLPAKGTIH